MKIFNKKIDGMALITGASLFISVGFIMFFGIKKYALKSKCEYVTKKEFYKIDESAKIEICDCTCDAISAVTSKNKNIGIEILRNTKNSNYRSEKHNDLDKLFDSDIAKHECVIEALGKSGYSTLELENM